MQRYNPIKIKCRLAEIFFNVESVQTDEIILTTSKTKYRHITGNEKTKKSKGLFQQIQSL